MIKSMAAALTLAMFFVPQYAFAEYAASGVASPEVVAPASAVAAVRDGPDDATILKWAKIEEENPEVESVISVLLKNGERAYVARILRFRGRNNMYGAYLVRPRLQEAREIDSGVLDIEPVPVEARDSNKIVIITTGSSGQGDAYFSQALVSFSGWNADQIHEVAYKDLDTCENYPDANVPCVSSGVSWKFEVDTTNVLVLKERVEVVEWTNSTDCKIAGEAKVKKNKTVITTSYRIKGLRLLTGHSNKEEGIVEDDGSCIPQKAPHKKKSKKMVS